MRKFMGWVLVVIGICASVAKAETPEDTTPTVDDVRQLLQANGMWDLSAQAGPAVAEQLVLALHRANPSLPVRADAIISDVVVSYLRKYAKTDHVAESLIPIYQRRLTKSDVQRITEFYRSPADRKLAAVTPMISLASAKVGQDWMASILPGLQAEVVSRLKAEKLIQ